VTSGDVSKPVLEGAGARQKLWPCSSDPGCATPACSGSIGTISDRFDNSVVESFFGSLHSSCSTSTQWPDHTALAQVIFEWIEARVGCHCERRLG
jgi:hypothetical protein